MGEETGRGWALRRVRSQNPLHSDELNRADRHLIAPSLLLVTFWHEPIFAVSAAASWQDGLTPLFEPVMLGGLACALALSLSLTAGIAVARLLQRLQRDLSVLRAANERLQVQFQDCQSDTYCRLDLQEQARYWRAQYQKLPFPAYTWQWCDEQLILRECNEAAIAQTRGAVLHHLGQSSDGLFAASEQWQQDAIACLSSQTASQGLLIARDGEREQTWTAHYTYLAPDIVSMVLIDATVGQELSGKVARDERQRATIVRLSELNARALSLDDYLSQAMALVAETLTVGFSQVLELLPNESAFGVRASFGWPQAVVEGATVTAAPSSQGGYVKQCDRPVQFDDLRLETRFRGSALLHNYNIVSGIGVPIRTTTGFYGVLGVYAQVAAAFTAADSHFLEIVSHAIAVAVERDRQQAQLHLFKRAIAASSNGIFISDALSSNATLLYVNPGFEKLTGYLAPEAIGRGIELLVEHASDPQTQQALQTALFCGNEYHASVRYEHPDRSDGWIELDIAPVRNSHGHLTHFIGIQTDISKRKRVEADLRSERDLLNSIMETSVTAILVLDGDHRVTYANEQAETLLHLRRSDAPDCAYELPDWQLVDFAGGVFPEAQLPSTQVLATGKPVFDVRYAAIWPDGRQRYLTVNGAPLRDTQGTIVSIVCSVADITDQFYFEQALRQSEEQFRRLFALAPIGMMLAKLDGRIIQANPALCTALGYSEVELLSKNTLDLTHPDDQAADLAIANRLADGALTDCKLEKRLMAQGRQVVHALLQVVVLTDDSGQPSYTLSQIVDITEHKQAEAALWMSEQRLEGILNSIEDVVWSSSAESLLPLYLNPATEQVYGRPVSDFFLNPNLWIEAIHPDDRAAIVQQIEQFQQELGHLEAEYRILRPDGCERWLYTRCHCVRRADGTPARVDGISTDITERKQAEAQLRHSAFYDALTDLPNRALFIDRLWHTLRRATRRGGYLFAVLFLDLDSFKVVNDSLGHAIGDRLLIAIARRLEGCLRPSDTLARLGGDEFTVLLENIENEREATQIAQAIGGELQRPFKIDHHKIYSNASIGIAFSHLVQRDQPQFGKRRSAAVLDYERPEDLLRDADTAMYRAKLSGKGCYAIFDRKMHDQAIARLHLEVDLRHAIERHEFSLYYQPIVSLVTHKLAGFEALLRWQHPERGLISPTEFIPIAEETGAIVPLGNWVLRATAQQLQAWQQAYPEHHNLTVSVNLSNKQLREPDLLEHIDAVFAETGLLYSALRFEITESILMENTEAATKLLRALRERQIQIGIDDFGTGYSSLSYLHRLPASTLKIDRSFIARMNPDGSNSEIVRAIVTLAQALGMDVIAEGIETAAQFQHVCQLGCEYGQGYFWAKPLPAAAAAALIATGLPRPFSPTGTTRQPPSG